MTWSRRPFARAVALVTALALVGLRGPTPAASAPLGAEDVTKATLPNGLRVVVVRNTLAAVVSTDLAYLVGTRDDPAAFPGMAHAQEHMMFRGTPDLSTSELGTIATALGGDFNASTSETLTQFNFTVPAANLDAILHIESNRMRDVLDAQAEWQNERGAIEQEVIADGAAPGSDFFRQAQAAAYGGTPYAHEGVGTVEAFNRLTGPDIKRFWQKWYAPNNAVLVIAGDVDPAATIASVRSYFGPLARKPIPAHAHVPFAPLHRTQIIRKSSLVYPLAAVGFRMPGVSSPDFLASFLLQQTLDATRGPLHELANSGQALDGEWVSFPYFNEGQLGFATAALPQGGDPLAMTRKIEGILHEYAAHGVPRELFETTKRQAISGQELSRNSISALASDWATTIALDDEPSIAREQQLLAGVGIADVNRVARTYLVPEHEIIGALTPSANASDRAAPQPPATGPEKPIGAQAPTELPDWAKPLLAHITVPASNLAPVRSVLPNGITLIVQPETISDSVVMAGNVRTNPALEEPYGSEGVASVLEGLFDDGTATRDRTTYQHDLDALDAQASAGSGFGLQATSNSFGRAVALLAENELHPRFTSASFDLAKRRAVQQLDTSLNSTGSVAQRRLAAKLVPTGDPTLRQPTLDGLRALRLNDLRTYYGKAFRPDLTTIVVVGNITPAAASAAISRAFADWHATGAPPALDLPPIPRSAAGDVTLTLPIDQTDVSLAQMFPLARTAPLYYPLMLGDAILGGGSVTPEQSRLFRDLRQNAGLVYSVSSSLGDARGRAKFQVDYASLPGNAAKIATMIDDEIYRMQTQPVGTFELSLIKASIVRRTIIGDASLSSIGSSLLNDAVDGSPLDQDHIAAEKILATDAADVQQAFSTYVKPADFVKLSIGP